MLNSKACRCFCCELTDGELACEVVAIEGVGGYPIVLLDSRDAWDWLCRRCVR